MTSEPQNDGGIGPRIRRLRVARDLAIDDLGARDATAAGLIQSIEAGLHTPDAEMLQRLACVLSCRTEYLQNGIPGGQRRDLRLQLAQAEQLLDHGATAAALERYGLLAENPAVIITTALHQAAVLGTARAYEAAGHIDAALDRLRRLREDVAVTDPPWASMQALLARCHRRRNDAGGAAAVAATALDRIGDVPAQHRPGSYIVLAAELLAAYNALGERTEADQLALTLRGVADSRHIPHRLQEPALWEIARTAIGRGDLREAHKHARKAYEAARIDGSAPSFAPAHRWATLLLSTGDRATGAQAVAILHHHRPSAAASPEISVACTVLLVRCRILAGDVKGALRDCQELMLDAADAPRSLQALARTTLGETLAANGDVEGAMAELTAVWEMFESRSISNPAGELARYLADAMTAVAKMEEGASAAEQAAGHVARAARRSQQASYSLPASGTVTGARIRYL
ncbi:hypothetical protein GCM10029978_066510 [Actinoallomurus acanthiterrae]